MGVAFFDMDRTLLDCNSGRLWVQHEWRTGRLRLRDAGLAMWWLVKYSLGSHDLEEAFEVAIASLKDTPEKDLEDRCRVWFEDQVQHRVRPGALDALRRHREAGDRLVLATSSSPYAGMPCLRAYELDDLVCTRMEVVDGVFTGKIAELAFGHHKLDRTREWAARNDVDLSTTAFYTDSVTDLALLEEVGEPVAVNPDRGLASEAAKRGWRIEDWGTSG